MASGIDKLDRRSLLRNMMVAAGLSAVPHPLLGERVRVSPSLQQVATGTESDIESFHIDVPESDLQVLRRRLDQLRWPKFAPGEAWSYGTDRQYLEELLLLQIFL